MVRWLPVFACGCLYVSDEDFLERLDNDFDGVFAAEDCDDGDSTVSQLPIGPFNILECGTTITARDLRESFGFKVRMPCEDPTDSDRLHSIPNLGYEFLFVEDFATTAEVRFFAPSTAVGDVNAEDDVILINRGRLCGVDRCSTGAYPIDGTFSDNQRFATARFDAAPGEEIFLLTTVRQSFRVSVDCIPEPPEEDTAL